MKHEIRVMQRGNMAAAKRSEINSSELQEIFCAENEK